MGKRAIRAKTSTNVTQVDMTHIRLLHINYVIHTTTGLRLPQIYAVACSLQKECLYFRCQTGAIILK